MLPPADENERQLRDETGTGEGFLYRYRDITGERAEWVRQIIVDSQLYFTSPENINDPFDCRVRYHATGSEEEHHEFARSLLTAGGLSEDEIQVRLRKLPEMDVVAQRLAHDFQKDVNRIGMLSMSSSHESSLMWAYYGGGYRGVCLQFRVAADPDFFGYALPVKYADIRPIPGLMDWNRTNHQEQLLLTKSADWMHEREWRCFDHASGPGLKTFPPELLTGIILGPQISTANMSLVLRWNAQRASPVAVYHTNLRLTEYGLEFTKLGG